MNFSVSIPVAPLSPVKAMAFPEVALKEKYWLVPSLTAATATAPTPLATLETNTVLPSSRLVAFSPAPPADEAGTLAAVVLTVTALPARPLGSTGVMR